MALRQVWNLISFPCSGSLCFPCSVSPCFPCSVSLCFRCSVSRCFPFALAIPISSFASAIPASRSQLRFRSPVRISDSDLRSGPRLRSPSPVPVSDSVSFPVPFPVSDSVSFRVPFPVSDSIPFPVPFPVSDSVPFPVPFHIGFCSTILDSRPTPVPVPVPDSVSVSPSLRQRLPLLLALLPRGVALYRRQRLITDSHSARPRRVRSCGSRPRPVTVKYAKPVLVQVFTLLL